MALGTRAERAFEVLVQLRNVRVVAIAAEVVGSLTGAVTESYALIGTAGGGRGGLVRINLG